MRPTLSHSTTERRRRHLAAPWRRSRDVEISPTPGSAHVNGAFRDEQVEQTSSGQEHVVDRASHRVRAAGGPLDVASYSCCCGMVFSASVSTSVACPHCGTEQDW